MGSLQRVLEKYHLEKWFKRDNLVVLVLAGILLVVITIPIEEPEKEKTTAEKGINEEVMFEIPKEEYEKWYSYATYLEEELETILSKVKGVGEVSVMITLESSEEIITQKDESLVLNETMEQDAQGGTRTVTGTDRKEETVFQKVEGEETPYITKTKLPEISGVLIVAQGAGNATVKKRIVEIAEALFALEVHEITVVEMN